MQTSPMNFQQLIGQLGNNTETNLVIQPVSDVTSGSVKFSDTLHQLIQAQQSKNQAEASLALVPNPNLPAATLKGTPLPADTALYGGPSGADQSILNEQLGDDITELAQANIAVPAYIPPTIQLQTNIATPTDLVDTQPNSIQSVVEPLAGSMQPNQSSVGQDEGLRATVLATGQVSNQVTEQDSNSAVATTTVTPSPFNTTDLLPGESIDSINNSKRIAQLIQVPEIAIATVSSTIMNKSAANMNNLANSPLAHLDKTSAIADPLQMPSAAAMPHTSVGNTPQLMSPVVRNVPGLSTLAAQTPPDTTIQQNAPLSDAQTALASDMSRGIDRLWSSGYRGSVTSTQEGLSSTTNNDPLIADTPDVTDVFTAETAAIKPILNRGPMTSINHMLAQYQLNTQPGSQAWGSELGQRVVWMAQQSDSQQALLQLNPRHLGPMEIQISVNHDQQVNLSFTAHNAAVRDALDNAMPRLREMLDQQGLTLSDANVSDRQSRQQEQSAENRMQYAATHIDHDGIELPEIDNVGSTSDSAGAVIKRRVDLYA